jgi:hypothetical protein
MSIAYDTLLTIALPAGLEEELLDVLRAHPQWVNGFSVLRAEGFGSGAALLSSIEQVRGRSERRMVQVLLAQLHLEPLLEVLRNSFASSEVAWWTTPVTGFGRLA